MPAKSATSRAALIGDHEDEKQFLEAYGEYAKTLRTWLVAYGVGAPVLFLTNDRVSDKMSRAPATPFIAMLFLIGVALQVGLATLNKTAMWACYHRERNLEECHDHSVFRFFYWISSQFWIDFLVDLVTSGLFAYATILAFNALV